MCFATSASNAHHCRRCRPVNKYDVTLSNPVVILTKQNICHFAARRLHYEGIIYRFQFLMLATLLCAALTVIGFIMGQVSEGKWKWDDNVEVEFTSAFLTGVYGMWNIYIFALIILYAPSHKQWPSNSGNGTPGNSLHDSATGIQPMGIIGVL